MKKVLKFSATWCGPCKILTNVMKDINSPVEIEEIDIDQNSDFARQHNIRGVPTLVMFENGAEVKRISGLMNKVELENWLYS